MYNTWGNHMGWQPENQNGGNERADHTVYNGEGLLGKVACPWDFLVIVSFATLSDEDPNSMEEIFSFPFIVLELNNAQNNHMVQVFDSQQMFAKPVWNKIGPQSYLAYSPQLIQCIRKFDAYVYTQFTTKNKSFCLVAENGWDLRDVLRTESNLKGIKLASYFDRYFDLVAEFRSFYPDSGVQNLVDMARFIGVSMNGESKGMENCKIIANILASLVREGYQVTDPVNIPLGLSPEPRDRSGRKSSLVIGSGNVSSESSQANSHANSRRNSVIGRQSPIGSSQLNTEAHSPDKLPNHARSSARGSRKNSSGSDEGSIVSTSPRSPQIIQSYKGAVSTKIGGVSKSNAWNRSSSPVNMVLNKKKKKPDGRTSRNGETLGNGKSKASSSKSASNSSSSNNNSSNNSNNSNSNGRNEAAKKKKKDSAKEAKENDPEDTRVVRLRGLPWDATDTQLAVFFEGLAIAEGGTVWTFNHRNRPTGEAYVIFETKEDAKKCFMYDKKVLGKRYVEIFYSTMEHAETARLKKGAKEEGEGKHGKRNRKGRKTDNAETVVMMYGLPFTVTVVEIEEFLKGSEFVAGSIEIELDAAGKAMGKGQVTFSSYAEATKAIHEKHRTYIGKRYINLHLKTN